VTPLEFLALFSDPASLSPSSLVVAFAYYLRQHRGQLEFTSTHMRDCLHEALLPIPHALTDLLHSLATGPSSPLLPGSSASRYSLSVYGLREVEDVVAAKPASAESVSAFLDAALPYLQKTVAKVSDENQRKFLAEAISCLGVQARRATIVMTWLATLDHLYDYVMKHKLAEFNAALARRTDKYSTLVISSKDDFSEMREVVFVEVVRSAGVITNDVRKILDEKLGIRNSCAHPSTIEIHDSKVVSFIEDLIDNVVAKYPL